MNIPEADKKNFGWILAPERLKEIEQARNKKGLTQNGALQGIGLSPAYIARLEGRQDNEGKRLTASLYNIKRYLVKVGLNPDNKNYYTQLLVSAKLDERTVTLTKDEFAASYRNMAYWREFPVPIFSGQTTLDDALESNIVTRSEKKGEEAHPELDMAIAGLHEVRFHRETPPEVASVLDTLANLQKNGKPQRLLIFGEAGDGKSTLLRVLGRAYLAENKFPVLIRAREWEDSKKSLSDFLRDSYLHDKEEPLKSGGEALWEKVKAGDAPLLIDGLDEVQRPEEIRTKLGNVARACRGTDDKGAEPTIVVTSRRQGYSNALPDYAHVELQTFDFEKQVKPYVRARLKDDAEKFLVQLQDDARSRALTGNGLMLAMLCMRWEQLRNARGNTRFELPVSRGELYDWSVELLLANPKTTRREEHTTFHDKFDMKLAILASVAFHAQLCYERILTIDRNLVKKALAEVTDKGSAYASDHALRHAILNDIVLNSELLSCDESGTVYRFFHPTFQEYFAALYMVQHWDAEDWRDWLPTREGWQEWGYPDLPWPSLYEDGETMRQREFCCPVCRNQFPPFPEMLLRAEYRETFLLMVGLLNNAQQESIFLNGIARDLPPIRGYESETYQKGIRYHAWFDTNDALDGEMWKGDTLQEKKEGPYLETSALLDDLQTWLEWGVQAASRCEANHSAMVRRTLAGLLSVSWRRNYFATLQLLGRSRQSAQSFACITFYSLLLVDRDNNDDLREGIAKILGGIGNPEAVPTLVTILTDSFNDDSLREKAAEALGELGSLDAVPALVAVLTDTANDEYLRVSATDALGKIGGEKVVSTLLAILADRAYNDDLCLSAALALGELGSLDAVPALVAVLNDTANDYRLRGCAATALGNIGNAEIVSILLAVFSESSNYTQLHWNVAEALSKIGGADAIAGLVAVLTDPTNDYRPRWCAAKALGNTGNLEVVPVLLSILTDNSNHNYLRQTAAEALGELGSLDAISALVAVLNDTANDEYLRVSATNALGKIGGEKVVSTLLAVLSHGSSGYLFMKAVEVLGKIGGADAVAGLVAVLINETETGQRQSAAVALGKIGDAETVPALIAVLNDMANDYFLRMNAVDALGNIGGADAVPALSAVLTGTHTDIDNDEYIRQRAAEALGNIGSAARSVLEQFDLQSEVNMDVGVSVIRALLAIRDIERARRTR